MKVVEQWPLSTINSLFFLWWMLIHIPSFLFTDCSLPCFSSASWIGQMGFSLQLLFFLQPPLMELMELLWSQELSSVTNAKTAKFRFSITLYMVHFFDSWKSPCFIDMKCSRKSLYETDLQFNIWVVFKIYFQSLQTAFRIILKSSLSQLL